MKKFKLTNVADNEVVGTYDTKVEAIEAMNETIDETNDTNDETEEEGLSPFDFKLEVVEVNDDASAITSFEEARKYLGGFPNADFAVSKKILTGNILKLEDVTLLVQELNPNHIKAIIALNRLFSIAEAWNKADGFVPDFADRSQTKWFPWFKWSDDTAGFVCAFSCSTASYARAGIGSRLCFATEDIAEQFGKRFINLYNQVFSLNNAK